VTCGAYVLLARLLQLLPISRVVLYYYLVPPTAILYAIVLFGETPTAQELLGVAVAIAGVVIALSAPGRSMDQTDR
jgi:drug/metabolite transporter (DMT)-like permease